MTKSTYDEFIASLSDDEKKAFDLGYIELLEEELVLAKKYGKKEDVDRIEASIERTKKKIDSVK